MYESPNLAYYVCIPGKKKGEGNKQAKPTIMLGILGRATFYIVISTWWWSLKIELFKSYAKDKGEEHRHKI